MRPRDAWLAYWRAMRRWHRFRTEGLHHLDRGPVLLVGYHGRPIAHDLCMLTVDVFERQGHLPHGIIHGAFDTRPRLKAFIDDLGFVTGDSPALTQAVARGEHVLVAPGGTREGCRSFRDRYRVSWGPRTGYVKLAARLGIPIVPVGASGVDDVVLGLNDGYALGNRVGMPAGLPLWFGLGPTGFWPLTPTFPVAIRQRLGAPIPPPDPRDRDALAATHQAVTAAVQGLLDDLNGRPHVSAAPPPRASGATA